MISLLIFLPAIEVVLLQHKVLSHIVLKQILQPNLPILSFHFDQREFRSCFAHIRRHPYVGRPAANNIFDSPLLITEVQEVFNDPVVCRLVLEQYSSLVDPLQLGLLQILHHDDEERLFAKVLGQLTDGEPEYQLVVVEHLRLLLLICKVAEQAKEFISLLESLQFVRIVGAAKDAQEIAIVEHRVVFIVCLYIQL